jgi:uncharacterized membrane protein YgdD (TMEM256/DUF423 family)
MPKPAYLIFSSAMNGFCAVLLGALGAHALKGRLVARDSLAAWETASSYQLAHAVGAVAVLAWAATQAERRPALHRVALSWLIGSFLFSGSIYVLALGGPRWLGPVTPLGGIAFLIGWVLMAAEGLRRPAIPSSP